jgi:hypothetical protein
MAISAQHTKFVYPDYVSPLPADVYISGMEAKQQQYNVGRQQLQDKIDLYGQIKNELVKPEDINYFDAELTSMLESVNKNAGLDFSVKANVDAVMNIGKPLENNQNLKNALTSSKVYNTMMAEFKALDPEQRGAANDYFFMKKINSWYSDGQPGSKLEYSSYTPYGIDKKAYGEVMSQLKPITKTVNQITPDGRFIQKQVISEVSAERFKSALLARFGEQGKQQLLIDAQYRLETQGKEYVASEYLNNMSQIAEGMSLRLQKMQGEYQTTVKTLGANSPEATQLSKDMSDLSKRQDVIVSNLNGGIERVDNSSLINYLIDQDLMDVSGSYAYSSVEEDIKDNPYALEAYKSELNMAEYQQKAMIDIEEDRLRQSLGLLSKSGKEQLAPPPMGAQETNGDVLKNTTPIYDFTQVMNSNQTPEEYNDFKLAFARHFADAPSTEDKEGRVIVGEGKNTIQNVLERFVNENTFDSKDYNVLVRAFGGASKTENFLWKLKGLAAKVGINTLSSDKISNSILVENDSGTFENKVTTPTSTMVVNYSVPGYKPYSRRMTVQDFLRLPANQLLNIQSANLEHGSLTTVEDGK